MATKKQHHPLDSIREDQRRAKLLAGILVNGFLNVSVDDIHGRLAARTYAYSRIANGEEEVGNVILDAVGEED